jgi:hypothetical protein
MQGAADLHQGLAVHRSILGLHFSREFAIQFTKKDWMVQAFVLHSDVEVDNRFGAASKIEMGVSRADMSIYLCRLMKRLT